MECAKRGLKAYNTEYNSFTGKIKREMKDYEKHENCFRNSKNFDKCKYVIKIFSSL